MRERMQGASVMARIRTIKPSFFRHAGLYDAERAEALPLRVAFAGLWTACDRDGRFPWKPRELKLDCLPFDDCDFAEVMGALAKYGFVVRYEAAGSAYGYVPSWDKHQAINQREAQSVIPPPAAKHAPASAVQIPEQDIAAHVQAHADTCIAEQVPRGVNVPGQLREAVFERDGKKCVRCESEDDLSVDHIFPQCIGGTHSYTNLRTLCRRCNSARPVAGAALDADLARDGFTRADMQRICTHVHAPVEGKGREGKDASTHALITSELSDVPIELVYDWLKVRRAKKAPLTKTAISGMRKQAEKAGVSMTRAVEVSTELNWQAFRADWYADRQPKVNGSHFGKPAEDMDKLFRRGEA